jgi:hypothetical protein
VSVRQIRTTTAPHAQSIQSAQSTHWVQLHSSAWCAVCGLPSCSLAWCICRHKKTLLYALCVLTRRKVCWLYVSKVLWSGYFEKLLKV